MTCSFEVNMHKQEGRIIFIFFFLFLVIKAARSLSFPEMSKFFSLQRKQEEVVYNFENVNFLT